MEQESLITDEMRALIGQERGSTTSEEVTTTEIRRFAQALFDENAVYYDAAAAAETKFGGIVAPGPFAPQYTGRRAYDEPDPMENHDPNWSGDGNPRLPRPQTQRIRWPEGFVAFHGGDDLEVRQLARPGERITATSRLVDVRERVGRTGRLGFTVTETVYTNEKGEILCINRFEAVARKV
jgi:acyl dehydratase